MARFIFCPKARITPLASRKKFPIPARPKPCKSWMWTATGEMICCSWIGTARLPFRLRLQNASGQLGPEIYFKMQPIRSYWADNLEETATNYVVTIAQNSGRAEVSEFTRKPAEILSGAFQQGQFQILPLEQNGRGATRHAVGRCQRRWPPRSARGRAGQRPDFGLFATAGRVAGRAENFPDAGGREPDCGGGLERRRQAGHFSVERQRKCRRRDAIRQKRTAAVSNASFRSTANRW